VAIIVTGTGGSNGELSVGYTTTKGSATEGAIYTIRSGSSLPVMRSPKLSPCPSSTAKALKATRRLNFR
jgi:hypothetical protein